MLLGSGSTKTIENGNDLDVAGDLTIGAGATLYGVANAEDIDIKGDWVNNGTYAQGAEQVTFSGAASQMISGSTTTFFDVVLTSAGVSLSGVDMNVAGALNLGATIVTTGETRSTRPQRASRRVPAATSMVRCSGR